MSVRYPQSGTKNFGNRIFRRVNPLSLDTITFIFLFSDFFLGECTLAKLDTEPPRA